MIYAQATLKPCIIPVTGLRMYNMYTWRNANYGVIYGHAIEIITKSAEKRKHLERCLYMCGKRRGEL